MNRMRLFNKTIVARPRRPSFCATLCASLALLHPLVFPPPAAARLTIEITEGVKDATPIAVVPFGWQGTQARPPQDLGLIIESNLKRSGRFSTLDRRNMVSRPTTADGVNLREWRLLKTDYVVVGRVSANVDGGYLVRAWLINALTGGRLADMRYMARREGFRRLAHQITDIIYEKLTGEPGAFNTRIAYITATAGERKVYHLYVADSDGYNAQSVLRSRSPIMSPTWSPDGRRLAYVSFERRRAQIYAQEIASGQRELLSDLPGINGAPTWSPDGLYLALTLSHGGNADIYLYDMRTKRLRRVTSNSAIDTEPEWAPDGGHILFTSDRGGSPQLYKIPIPGGRAERVTYQGDYNAHGVYSPDGEYIAMEHGIGGRYHIAVQEVATGRLRILTNGALDESPSFAPNGRILLYATHKGNVGVLSAVSVDGGYQQRLDSSDGDVREPSWSPYNQ